MTRVKKVSSTGKRKLKPKVLEHPRSSVIDFTSREIGWLNFNYRVLNEAKDLRTPLLERLKFLAICNSNLDEFFMKRVGGLKRQVAFGISPKSADGKTPTQQLHEIRLYVNNMVKEQAQVFKKVLKPALKDHGIFLVKWSCLL